MDVTYTYEKKRSEFGRQCIFNDKGPDMLDNFPSNRRLLNNYILRDPVVVSTQGVPIQAQHYLNTTRAEYNNTGITHLEGGWPKDVNIADEEQPKRYRRKVEKDETYYQTVMALTKSMETWILQNNAVNIYQQYFSDVEPTPLIEPNSARTVNFYQDQYSPIRPVTNISWSPDNHSKLAISHCDLGFQTVSPTLSNNSFIWTVENPNTPMLVLHPEHPIVCLEYNPKDPNLLMSGQLNGQVAVWDTRKGPEPVELSVKENSYRDPVTCALWINTKSGTEFFAAAPDGYIKWWDTRKISEPTDVLMLDLTTDEQTLTNSLGASVLEYEPTIPTRFMVGTEQGKVISCNRKGKTPLEKMTFKFMAHYGPVLGLQRNPAFSKNFLTIGDWTARIWSEDCRESSIIWTSFHKAQLTAGAWSPSRLSVFMTTRNDGILDVWDILQQQKKASLTVKVSDYPLTCIRTHDNGRLVAVADKRGNTYLIELSENLQCSNKNDKMLMTAMFEREAKREKILEARHRELRLKAKGKSIVILTDEEEEEKKSVQEDYLFADPNVVQAEQEFFLCIEEQLAVPELPEEEGEEEEIEEVMIEMRAPPIEDMPTEEYVEALVEHIEPIAEAEEELEEEAAKEAEGEDK